jgi:hypothetical protein
VIKGTKDLMHFPSDLGTWGFVLSILAIVLMYPMGILINFTSPKVSDWWAGRSMRRLEHRIALLEEKMRHPPIFEEEISRFYSGCMTIVMVAVLFALTYVPHPPGIDVNSRPSWSREHGQMLAYLIRSGLLIFVYVKAYLLSFFLRHKVIVLARDRERYRESLGARIGLLKSHLANDLLV